MIWKHATERLAFDLTIGPSSGVAKSIEKHGFQIDIICVSHLFQCHWSFIT
jgi:hypothetical protein